MQVRRLWYHKTLENYEEKPYQKMRVKSSLWKHAQYKIIRTLVQVLSFGTVQNYTFKNTSSVQKHKEISTSILFFLREKKHEGSHRISNYSSPVVNLRKRSTWLRFTFWIVLRRRWTEIFDLFESFTFDDSLWNFIAHLPRKFRKIRVVIL